MMNEHYSKKIKRSRSNDNPKNYEKNSEVGACEFICYNCGTLGHVSKDCRKFDQQTKGCTKSDSFDEFVRATSRSQHSIMNLSNQMSNSITRIDPIKNFPAVKLTLCYPSKEIMQVGDVMIDTGACTACIDYTLANRLKAYVLPSNMEIQGIVGGSQPIQGAAYALLKHATIKKPKLLKFQVLMNFDAQMLLGRPFIEIFFAGMINNGGTYQVKLRDKSDGDWLTPELLLRFCTPEESIKLFRIHDLSTFEAIAARRAFLDAMLFYYSRYEEETSPELEMDSDWLGEEYQKTI